MNKSGTPYTVLPYKKHCLANLKVKPNNIIILNLQIILIIISIL